jgi:hypothetical protein
LSHVPLLLYDLAQAHRLAGNCPHAKRFYDEFLATEPEGEIRARAQAQLRKLADCAPSTRAETAMPSALAPAGPTLPPPARRPTPRAVLQPAHGSESTRDGRGRVLRASIGFGSAALLLGSSAYFGWRANMRRTKSRRPIALARPGPRASTRPRSRENEASKSLSLRSLQAWWPQESAYG